MFVIFAIYRENDQSTGKKWTTWITMLCDILYYNNMYAEKYLAIVANYDRSYAAVVAQETSYIFFLKS